MTNRTKDMFPAFKTAGVTANVPNDSSANCIKPSNNNNPGTPEHLKKYRKSYKNSFGQTILHYGVYDDEKPQETFVYGHKITGSDHVNQIIESQKQGGVKQMINEIKEANYQSRKVESLGKRMERNYEFPDEVQKEDFHFGKLTAKNEYTGKEVIFSQNPCENDEAARLQYIRSHGNYEAGEQKNRGYNWNVNPQNHRFGKIEQSIPNQVSQCLNMETHLGQQIKFLEEEEKNNIPELRMILFLIETLILFIRFPKTQIIKKKQEDFRNFKNDHLGIPKNMGQENGNKNDEIAFGARLGEPDEWNAGESTINDVKPDSDLGKTNRFGFRNTTKEGDQNRIFGVPTIRSDITKTSMKSIADPNNYGDEKPALQLLFPRKHDLLGVDEGDFQQKRHKFEIKDIFEKIGYKYKIGKFEGIFKRALEIIMRNAIQKQENSLDAKCSVKSFLQAVHEMDHIQ